MMHRHIHHHAALAATAIALAIPALAGPLTPPAGAPAPTNKTLQQVEPRIPLAFTGTTIQIDQPGSYYLTDNILAPAGVTPIQIMTSGVTLDLSGFRIAPLNFGTPADGILIENLFFQAGTITIRNGSILLMTDDGIDSNTTIPHLVIENVTVSSSTDNGFEIDGEATITKSQAIENGAAGFFVTGGTFRECLAKGNGGDGFDLGDNPSLRSASTLESCIAIQNTGIGFLTLDPTSLTRCVAEGNGDNGFLSINASFDSCVARRNAVTGIVANDLSTIINCVAEDNGNDGIFANSGSSIANSSASFNGRFGMVVSNGVQITSSAAYNNDDGGFTLGLGAGIVSSVAYQNNGNGIFLNDGAHAIHCVAHNNGQELDAAGIYAGRRAVVDSCTVSFNEIGIRGEEDSLTIRNVLILNTQQTIFDPGARYATILGPTANFSAGNSFANLAY